MRRKRIEDEAMGKKEEEKIEKGDRIVVSSKVSIFHYQGCKGVIVGEWKERVHLRRFDVKLDDGRKVWFDEDEIEKELTEKQQGIFEKVKAAWEERVGKGNVDEEGLKRIIIVADTDKDSLKRVSLIGSDKVHLVPIEEIILNGLKGTDIGKYPTETTLDNEEGVK